MRVVLCALLLAASACSPAGTPSAATPPVAPAAATTTPLAARQSALVLSVTDGDTIKVRLAGGDTTVRYIGIDTAETVDPRTTVQCYANEASVRNNALVGGQIVELEKDVSETDRYGRLLRYVYVGGRMVNEILVREGYARASSYPPDVKYQETFIAAEREARGTSRGLWLVCDGPNPTLTAAPAPSATRAPVTSCDASYPDVCIAPPPPDLDCPDIPYRRFVVRQPDPHRFDGDRNGIGCQ